ncbi:hypothetical protein BCA37_20000 [Mycobacterium sp. djl-10]|nr:hypothetical protein BCA37_20000 [Mycobacterium sp. djl-10]
MFFESDETKAGVTVIGADDSPFQRYWAESQIRGGRRRHLGRLRHPATEAVVQGKLSANL